MKEKTKKILTGLGLGLASVGLLAIGVGVGACSVKNGSTQPVTTTPVRKGLNQRPNKAPSFEGENLFNSDNNLEGKVLLPSVVGDWGTGYASFFVPLKAGYYYYGNSAGRDMRVHSFVYDTPLVMSTLSALENGGEYPSILDHVYLFNSASGYVYLPTDRVLGLSGGLVDQFYIYLVDTLEVPSKNVISLPNNWSPFGLITEDVTDDNRFGLLRLSSPSSATIVGPDIELTNLVFRYRGVVYDRIYFSFNDASHSTGYVRSDGSVFDPLNQYVVLNVDTHVMSLNYVSFGQSWTGRYDQVVGARYSDTALPESPVNGVSWYPALGQYYWINGGRPNIEVIDEVSGVASGRYDGRYSNLSDLQLLELLSNYSAKTLDIGDTGMAFDLMTTSFGAVIPLLSIYVLPGLTLGMLLFLPLIGGIIVVIIKVVKK